MRTKVEVLWEIEFYGQFHMKFLAQIQGQPIFHLYVYIVLSFQFILNNFNLKLIESQQYFCFFFNSCQTFIPDKMQATKRGK